MLEKMKIKSLFKLKHRTFITKNKKGEDLEKYEPIPNNFLKKYSIFKTYYGYDVILSFENKNFDIDGHISSGFGQGIIISYDENPYSDNGEKGQEYMMDIEVLSKIKNFSNLMMVVDKSGEEVCLRLMKSPKYNDNLICRKNVKKI